jgi:glucosamine-phosphate N-acetyltransferase
MILIREIEYDDIGNGFLEVLDNLLAPDIDDESAKNILKKIKTNPLHKIFAAHTDSNDKIIGTTTLIVEPKFINKGMKVGYIEDVSVKEGYEEQGIGFKLVNYAQVMLFQIKVVKKYCYIVQIKIDLSMKN